VVGLVELEVVQVSSQGLDFRQELLFVASFEHLVDFVFRPLYVSLTQTMVEYVDVVY